MPLSFTESTRAWDAANSAVTFPAKDGARPVRCAIAGEGPLRGRLEAMVRDAEKFAEEDKTRRAAAEAKKRQFPKVGGRAGQIGRQ